MDFSDTTLKTKEGMPPHPARWRHKHRFLTLSSLTSKWNVPHYCRDGSSSFMWSPWAPWWELPCNPQATVRLCLYLGLLWLPRVEREGTPLS